MGETLSRMEPEGLAEFKGLPQQDSLIADNIEIPEREEMREKTDRVWLYFFGFMILLLMPCLIYLLSISDINRFIHGYDPCGNVCGQNNDFNVISSTCIGQNMTLKPYLEYTNNVEVVLSEELRHRRCVDKCDREIVFNRCLTPEEKITQPENRGELGKFLSENAGKIVLATCFSIGITLVMLFLFRTATAVVVWSILIGGLLLFTAYVAWLWIIYTNLNEYEKGNMIVACIIVTFIWFVLVCITIFMHRRIQLVVQLFKEATKAAFAMPQLMLAPILSFIVILIIYIVTLICIIYVSSSGTLTELIDNFFVYEITPFIYFTIFFNIIMAYWIAQFIMGIQYMTVAGAVSKWYFAKNKTDLGNPVTTSCKIVFKYHLGSIAFGSMIITIITIIRMLISSMIKNRSLKMCADCCLKGVDNFIKYLSKNAYILTAMHGKPFFKSGKRAAKIIIKNVVNIVVITNIGDFVIVMSQILIVLTTLLVTQALIKDANEGFALVVYCIVGINAAIVAITFFAVFETCVDTIFLCFCEDSLMNDGMARPYAMSRGLMEFVENSKKVLGEKKN